MKLQKTIFVLLLPVGAFAQSMMSASGSGSGSSFSGSATFSAQSLAMQPVIGAPYSGEQSQQQVQTLSDGTHITHSSIGQKTWRDSKGRTRTERPLFPGSQPGGQGSPQIAVVEIVDLVAGYRYVLDTQGKVAHRIALPPAGSAPATRPGVMMSGPNAIVIQMGLSQMAPPPPPPPPGAGISSVLSSGITGMGGGGRAGSPVIQPEMKQESLGTKVIDGVEAEGTRNTTTFATGTQGNDQPFSVTFENWYSQDLKLMLLSVTHDPRSGDNTSKIDNLSRNEPDLSLFVPPADYTIVDEKDTFTIQYKGQ
jgi:hypothetical protein